ncbi:MAG: glycine--tRNA ligase, partial [bacterium]
AYLRAETCQPIFTDFHLVRIASRQKLPFGIGQVGKAFRNEINPRFFTFRSREFSQMEMEFFCRENESMSWYEYWRDERKRFYTEVLGIAPELLRQVDHEQLAHYAKAALDIEFEFPFGWGEIEGVHHRGTWDMSRHQEYSGKDLRYFDQDSNERFLPTVVETSCGLDRLCLMLLCHGYSEEYADSKKEDREQDIRLVLRLPAVVAPVQAAVLPLSKKLNEPARDVLRQLQGLYRTEFDVTGSIGKRYRRQDEIGTPICVTFDFDSLEDGAVTVRDRDTMAQERVPIDGLVAHLSGRLS